MKIIKNIVTEKEVKALDENIKQIYNVDYDNNYSTAYNLGFNTLQSLFTWIFYLFRRRIK